MGSYSAVAQSLSFVRALLLWVSRLSSPGIGSQSRYPIPKGMTLSVELVQSLVQQLKPRRPGTVSPCPPCYSASRHGLTHLMASFCLFKCSRTKTRFTQHSTFLWHFPHARTHLAFPGGTPFWMSGLSSQNKVLRDYPPTFLIYYTPKQKFANIKL